MPFDYEFERDFPEEMPQVLLQHHMYIEMMAMRAEAAYMSERAALAPPLNPATSAVAGAEHGAGSMPGTMDADASAATA